MKQGWEIKKLGEVATFQRGLTYSKEDEVEFSENYVLRSNNIDLDSMSLVLDELKCIREDFVINEDKKVLPNTILICMSNGSKQHLGKVAYINKSYGYAFGGFMGLIKPNADVFAKYVYYCCLSPNYKHFLSRIGNGANISNLKFSDLSKFSIPIPSMEEQERIVAELDCLSGVIEKKREQLKELDRLAQSIFYTMFGDPITNEKHWQIKKLGEIAKITSGGTPSRNKPEYFTGDINWYSAGELNSMFLSNSIEKITKNALDETSAKLFPKGSLLVGMYDTAAFKLGILKRESSSNQACANVVLFEDNVIWLYYVLMLMKDEALKHRHGARQKNLNVGFIKSFSVPIPPLAIQQEFAKKIEAIEAQKELIKQSIAECEELFNSRMQYYFN